MVVFGSGCYGVWLSDSFFWGDIKDYYLYDLLFKENSGTAWKENPNASFLNLADKTNFSSLILLIKNASLLITTDSAPMHIGAACGTKTLAIFGPTDPKRHCPPNISYIYKKIPCSFCYRKKCLSMECMKEITVKDVLKKVEKLSELK